MNHRIDSSPSILFLGRKDSGNHLSQEALSLTQSLFPNLTICLGQWGDPFPLAAQKWKGDYILSYLSRWIVPKEVLAQAKLGAINFHPASPEYPGYGCVNFALYEEALEYGATCHFMNPRVDTGELIKIVRFPILKKDSVATLLDRTYQHLFNLYSEIVKSIHENKSLPKSNEKWSRQPFKKSDLQRISFLDPHLSPDEFRRRVRATDYGPWKPEIHIHGHRFILEREPETAP